MAEPQFRLEWDDAAAQAMFARLIAGGANLRPLMTEIGSALEGSTKERFETGLAPDGVAWVELKPATLKRKRTGRTLVERGDLLGSIRFEAGNQAVDIIAGPTAYAPIHQFGGTSDMAPGPAAIPARPYMGVSDDDAQEILEAASDYLNTLANGG